MNYRNTNWSILIKYQAFFFLILDSIKYEANPAITLGGNSKHTDRQTDRETDGILPAINDTDICYRWVSN